MSAETVVPASQSLLNRESNYIQSLRQTGFQMKEVRKPASRFNAIVYQQEAGIESTLPHRENNLLMLYAVQGEAGAQTNISASFLSELKPHVNTVMSFNSSLSKTSLETARYDHDLDRQADEIVALYEEEIPQDKRDQPLVLVGHSMGGTTAPIVARRLLERGFDVRKIIMIAPPVGERPSVRMLGDFLKLGSKEHVIPDIAMLYPSPADIAGFRDRLSALSEKSYLNPEEKEEKEAYELAIQRAAEPDKMTLSNMSQEEREAIQRMDAEMSLMLEASGTRAQSRVTELQKRRTKILIKAAKKVIKGKINNEPTQYAGTGKGLMRMAGHLARSTGEIRKTISDLANETTADAIDALIEYNNTLSDHPLDITLIAGETDPIPGNYEIGRYKETFGEEKIQVGRSTTVSEIAMTNFDHFSLSDDPVRVAQVVGRIMDKELVAIH